MDIDVFTNNKEVRLFEGFTLQKGFIFGFINGCTPFVSNGTIFSYGNSKYINVYFRNGQNEWYTNMILNSNPLYGLLYKKVTHTANKNHGRIKKEYATTQQIALQLEQNQIEELRRNGLNTNLFSSNANALPKRWSKPHNKQITNSITEANYLQTNNHKREYAI